MRLDFFTWNMDRLDTEAKLHALKEQTRAPGYRISTAEAVKLNDLSKAATRLYMLRAEMRGEGRLHCTSEVVYEYKDGRTSTKLVAVTREEQRRRVFGSGDWYQRYIKSTDPVTQAYKGIMRGLYDVRRQSLRNQEPGFFTKIGKSIASLFA